MTTQPINAYAALEAGAKLEPFTYDPGPLGAHEVELEVESCGICHSDLSVINDEWGFGVFPVVPGHEVVGIVSQVGDHVTSLEIGQRVGLGWHAGYCGSCPFVRKETRISAPPHRPLLWGISEGLRTGYVPTQMPWFPFRMVWMHSLQVRCSAGGLPFLILWCSLM